MALSEQVRGDGAAPQMPADWPERYHSRWDEPFRRAIEERLRDDLTILDVGSGRHPTIPVAERPQGCHYVGLDLSATELEVAGPGAYDEAIASDVGVLQDALIGRVDLAISWQVLEHVQDLGAAMVCMRAYLKPGGRFVALFSGSRSAFALINRVLPFHVGAPIVTKVMGRTNANPVFPAYYDRCTASELRAMLSGWSSADVVPLYRGASYFGFSKALATGYLAYEDWAERTGREDLATHYLLVAER